MQAPVGVYGEVPFFLLSFRRLEIRPPSTITVMGHGTDDRRSSPPFLLPAAAISEQKQNIKDEYDKFQVRLFPL